MLVLKILVQVQTFRWRPTVPSHNFCHPTENQDSSLIQENLWYLKTFTFSFNQNAPLPFVPFLLNVWWMRTPFVVVCPKFSNKQSLKSADIEKFEDIRSSKLLWMHTSFLYKYFQLGQNSHSKLWQKCGFVHLLRLHFDFCDLCLLVCLLPPPWLHFWLLWPPHLATWHLAGSNISLC